MRCPTSSAPLITVTNATTTTTGCCTVYKFTSTGTLKF
jgi:hypothetical protein